MEPSWCKAGYPAWGSDPQLSRNLSLVPPEMLSGGSGSQPISSLLPVWSTSSPPIGQEQPIAISGFISMLLSLLASHLTTFSYRSQISRGTFCGKWND